MRLTIPATFSALTLTTLLAFVSPGLASPQPAPAGRATTLSGLSDAIEDLSERVGPAVVQIFATAYTPRTGQVSTRGELVATQRGSGSGVILDPNGYIVTNAHVVAGARRIQVELAQRTREGGSILKAQGRVVGAQLVGIDEETDLAVLKIQETGLPVLPLADSDELRSGELVLAFGSPLGLQNSVTLGVVSAVARQLSPEDRMIYVQTDAPINRGSSGGPLVDTAGRVVGINTMMLSQSGGNEGLGFAAPSNIVRNVYEQIRDTGRVRRGEIGMRAQTVTPKLAAGLGLPQEWGVIVADVMPGGPAEAAGLEPGDLVLRLDGKPMENGRQFHVNLYSRQVGETVTVEVSRAGRTLAVPVVVTEPPNDPGLLALLADPQRNLVRRLGILGLSLEAELGRKLSLRSSSGVVVAATAVDALSSRQGGFAPGDAIRAVNGQRVNDLAGLRQRLERFKFGDSIVIQIERHGSLTYLAFTAEWPSQPPQR